MSVDQSLPAASRAAYPKRAVGAFSEAMFDEVVSILEERYADPEWWATTNIERQHIQDVLFQTGFSEHPGGWEVVANAFEWMRQRMVRAHQASFRVRATVGLRNGNQLQHTITLAEKVSIEEQIAKALGISFVTTDEVRILVPADAIAYIAFDPPTRATPDNTGKE